MKEDNVEEISDIWRTDEKEEQERVEAEVKEWFDSAKTRGSCGINLWYSPYNKRFFSVSKAVFVHGIVTSLLTYQGGLYETRAGSGDCEMNLWYLGEIRE